MSVNIRQQKARTLARMASQRFDGWLLARPNARDLRILRRGFANFLASLPAIRIDNP